jgi:amino acid permease
MEQPRVLWGSAGILAATTLGAGIFSLPYVFREAGWALGLFYLATLTALVVFVHALYLRALQGVRDGSREPRTTPRVVRGEHLLGLARSLLGRTWFSVGVLAVVGGLVLTLVAYLILAARFVGILAPGVPFAAAAVAFWLVATVPMKEKLRWFVRAEAVGTLFMAAIILLVFFVARRIGFGGVPIAVPSAWWLPFGPVLFALAGWTAVEPMFNYGRRSGGTPRGSLFVGTVGVAVLYALFVAAILGSATVVAPDTLSGLSGWPRWGLGALATLGLVAIWTSYVPIALEVRNSLTAGLGWSRHAGLAAVAVAPLALLFLGLKDFLAVVGLAGGVFLAAQYLLLLLVSRRILKPAGAVKFFTDLAALVFAAAALYEIYVFVLH